MKKFNRIQQKIIKQIRKLKIIIKILTFSLSKRWMSYFHRFPNEKLMFSTLNHKIAFDIRRISLWTFLWVNIISYCSLCLRSSLISILHTQSIPYPSLFYHCLQIIYPILVCARINWIFICLLLFFRFIFRRHRNFSRSLSSLYEVWTFDLCI